MATKTKNSEPDILVEDDRTGLETATLKRAFLDNLFYIQGKRLDNATRNDLYLAVAYTVRDRIMHRWLHSQKALNDHDSRVVGYLSAEFLMGPHLGNNLINLGLYETMEESLNDLNLNLTDLLDQEEEPGLGNGGLGRLAACFLDSLATLNLPAIGYGIRYEFGIFEQKIENGWQSEVTDKWLKFGNPWEIARNEACVEVKFGGQTENWWDENDQYRVEWNPDHVVLAIPYDTPILGYLTDNAAILRLWKAEATNTFDFQTFNRGDYFGAVDEKVKSENITKVLYPNDEQVSGRELRLIQQYFFVSATLQDCLRYHLEIRNNPVSNFHEKMTLQLNDTHPSVAVAELMRLLVDEHQVEWDDAWHITKNTFAYTNHTLLPEALERWPMPMFGKILPRHLEIILEINDRFLEQVKEHFHSDNGRVRRMSIIDESDQKYIRMAHLAIVGSYAVNGVAELHTHLLTQNVLHDFYEMWPKKFSNKTNGVAPRRWVVLSNRALTKLITSHIGDGWTKDLTYLKLLEDHVDKKPFQNAWSKAKMEAKEKLAKWVFDTQGIKLNTKSIFDIQVKRIHEYKRQHLNVLHIITLYNRLRDNPKLNMVPRTFIFGGKAAPGYFMAKLIIKLINSVAQVINNDPVARKKIKVVFIPDYNVKNSQQVYPAADVSEQISTAGKEASGTGNMKFTMNGALTIGTLDGANIEIREEVGEENFFLFGLTADEVEERKRGGYNPWNIYNQNHELKRCLDMLEMGYFSPWDEAKLFQPLIDNLKNHDDYMVLADYQSYIDCQDRISKAFKDQENWTRMSILNTTRSSKFSSDRTIMEYCEDIWKIEPIEVNVPDYDPKSNWH
ncbi:glycogen/starch/alpha-glucan phosphorylase [Marinoscillum sp. MHG1-6]|uniref:glycogen/starch/alpha-glucan phosphorylase n=1 Tax=Marinoscillum sp. MHG1-6 TaxID=2959627 RepID=UPI0021579FFE|nr:glycogen/starch/alpha-glucan phosphorylase [Marinoscillum sp. MHG1-6]